MALAGAPAQAPRHALLVGSNPAVTRVLRTYLQREGVRCREATPESVLRAATRNALTGDLDPTYVGTVAVALVIVSVGIDVVRLREALAALPATAEAPVLTVDSLAGEGLRAGTPGSPHLTLAWPFRLRDVMDAITTAVAVKSMSPVMLRPQAASTPLMVAPPAEAARAHTVNGGVSRS